MDGADDLLKLENQVCFAIVTAARNVVAIYRPVLEPLGLTHPQYLVMLALWESAPRSLRNLADELAMEPATLSPLVKRLEAQGRVTRTRRRNDERVLDIALTEAGVALRQEARRVPEQIMQRVGVDAAALAALRDGLAPFSGTGRA
ncbi:MarR family transcriptional regulator [Microbacterium sp. zg.Y625]|uniref:MarR family winged helix-turn-helix transcriptional regulator n=1 Tax=Microbacterium jiangjiandongii TaxID=3049071 RepID=UPI00214BAF5B|nr:MULTISPECIES: MarR family transcriptional regulator [unclassified Microbacterium]MCR2792516.1 MarR family transcriptional regulator [Microbacterium sp. zg.Y625]MCR2814799.1 MarR family transcriptional regulator [Microbacterium sp. zg.Y843]WIM26507.1 MarR family transcriptional regulator [Microbacterium sp. zg-Y625]